MPEAITDSRLLPPQPRRGLQDHLAAGGGQAWATALTMAPEEIINEVEAAGLRGRGGAGFPTGVKWRSVREAAAETDSASHLVVNGAEGEPGTYKDRLLLDTNPFQVLEGALIARRAVGADQVHIGVKQRTGQAGVLREAIEEVVAAGWEDADVLGVVEGPDEYLFGEETALLEVIEGGLPLPRWLPPFQQGLQATTTEPHPTAVNNVETLANVPFILTHGATEYRSAGTEDSPGTMLFTVIGDVENPGVYELPLGTPLRQLVVDIAGATDIKAVFSGVSSPVISPAMLDVPLTYEDMRTAGTGLGSGGYIVYDHGHCIVRVAVTLSNFLAIESCAQCTACKLGCTAITEWLRDIDEGRGTEHHLAQIRDRIPQITDQTRCALPAGEQLLVGSLLDTYYDEFTAHLARACDAPPEQVPKIEHLDDTTGSVTLDPDYHRKQPDWTYTGADEADDQELTMSDTSDTNNDTGVHAPRRTPAAPPAPATLSTIGEQLLDEARDLDAGRSARTLTPGAGAGLKQTVLALLQGVRLEEHVSPGPATIQVLDGDVRLGTADGPVELTAGQWATVPRDPHDLEALTDATVLLTVAADRQ